MAYDAHSNFPYSTVVSSTGTTITLQTGDGAHFPVPPFNITVWAWGQRPVYANSTILRVTGIAGDVLTVNTSTPVESAGARTILAGDQVIASITQKTLTDIEQIPHTLSKLTIAGHSYNMPAMNVTGAGLSQNLFTNGGSLRDRGQWPQMIQDYFNLGEERLLYVTYGKMALTDDATIYVPVPGDCWVSACSYFPGSSQVTGTTKRRWSLSIPQSPNSATYQEIALCSTVSGDAEAEAMTAGVEYAMCNALLPGNPFVSGVPASIDMAYKSAQNRVLWGGIACVAGGRMILLSDLHASTGVVENGGAFVIRLGHRILNYSVSGAMHYGGWVYSGSWATSMNPFWSPRACFPQYSGLPVNTTNSFKSLQFNSSGTLSTTPQSITVTANTLAVNGTVSVWSTSINSGAAGAIAMTYTGGGGTTTLTGCTIASGTAVFASGGQLCSQSVSCQAMFASGLGGNVVFPNGTLCGVSLWGVGATALTSSAVSGDNVGGDVAANQAGMIVGKQLGDETFTSHSAAVLLTGINDVANNWDVMSWRESVRAWAAYMSCSQISFSRVDSVTVPTPFDQNVSFSGGSGSWTMSQQPAAGQFGGSWAWFAGTPNSSSTITISLPFGYDGGPVDLFFLAWGGTNDGGTATITVDGATPPQGSVTIGTNSAYGANQGGLPWSGAGTTTITRTSGVWGYGDVGKRLLGPSIPNNTIIQSVTNGGTTAVCNNTIPSTTNTAFLLSPAPMVKRITGLSAGAHTITVTITGMQATTGDCQFGYLGYGIEPPPSNGLSAPVGICYISRILSQNVDSLVATANQEIDKVIAGTATVTTGSTSEPALQTSVFSIDIDTALGKQSKYFSDDGVHPNTFGHTVIANTISKAIKSQVVTIQAVSR